MFAKQLMLQEQELSPMFTFFLTIRVRWKQAHLKPALTGVVAQPIFGAIVNLKDTVVQEHLTDGNFL